MADKRQYNPFYASELKLIDLGDGTFAPVFSSSATSSSAVKTGSTAGNNTITRLDNGESFIGDFEQSNFPDVMVQVVSSTSGTLYFDFSPDPSNPLVTSVFPSNGFEVSAGVSEFHTAVKGPRSFRVRFINDSGSNQSYLYIYVYYGVFRQPNAPVNQTLGNDADAIVVRQYPQDIDLALGKLGGAQRNNKFGYTPELGTTVDIGTPSTWVDLWSYGGLRTSPTTTFTPYMASTAIADTDIDVEWTYLDVDGVERTVTIATNASSGRTPVSLGVTAQEVYRGIALSDIAGSITVTIANNFTNGAPDNQNEVLAHIPTNDNKTQVLARRVPVNKRFILQDIYLRLARASGADGSAILAFQIRESGGNWFSEFPTTITNANSDPIVLNKTLEPLTDFRIRIRDVSDNNTNISGYLNFIEVDI